MGIQFPSLETSSLSPLKWRLGQFIYNDETEDKNKALYNPSVNPNIPSDIPVKALAYGGFLAGLVSSFFKAGKSYSSLRERFRDWSFPVASFGVSALSFVLDYFSIDKRNKAPF